MQITIITCGEENGVVVSTGASLDTQAVFGGTTYLHTCCHERHPESPTSDWVQGVMNSFDVKMKLELLFDCVHQS
jgi:predicted metal-binding protein